MVRENFFQLVYESVRQIPKGKVTSYSEIAKYLGNPRATRAVGWAMRACTSETVPCHRVVRADGRISGDYPEGILVRIAKLRDEGVHVKEGKIVGLPLYFFNDFSGRKPRKRVP